jgi:hypothetical protein
MSQPHPPRSGAAPSPQFDLRCPLFSRAANIRRTAACKFARNTGKVVVIGSLSDIEAIVQDMAGTRISTARPGITWL